MKFVHEQCKNEDKKNMRVLKIDDYDEDADERERVEGGKLLENGV